MIAFSGCSWFGLIGGVTGTTSIMTITIMAFDRFTVISNPFKPRWLTKWKAIFLIVFVWLYGFGFSSPAFFEVAGRYTYDGHLMICMSLHMKNIVTLAIV